MISGGKRFVQFVDVLDHDCFIAHSGWGMLVREESPLSHLIVEVVDAFVEYGAA